MERLHMRLEVQKDLDVSAIGISQASSYISDQRSDARKKSAIKTPEYKRKQSNKLKQLVSKEKV